ncbi:MAG: hypothetical protein LUD72_06345 [Bacteroidales bacterium]|nr:hypothetical protein [Bacteroidales bacterium]
MIRRIINCALTAFWCLMALVFINLKLEGALDVGWGWVLFPVWVPIIGAIVAGVLAICMKAHYEKTRKKARSL